MILSKIIQYAVRLEQEKQRMDNGKVHPDYHLPLRDQKEFQTTFLFFIIIWFIFYYYIIICFLLLCILLL
jgi:hypothetical protein